MSNLAIALHSDLLSVGKCTQCNHLLVWLKKDKLSLKDAKCSKCSTSLVRTTFLSKLPMFDLKSLGNN